MSQHLHNEPVPPSRRLGAPVPADLEAVLLACLRKTPGERPADARTLRQRLRACRDLGTWELEDARAWWATHGDAIRERRVVPENLSGAQTIDVALQVLRS